MKPFFALLDLNFKSMLLTTMNIGRRGKNRKAATGLLALILLSLLMLFLSSSYSFSMAAVFAPANALDIMLMMMVIVAIVFSMMFILYGAQSQLFSTKDVDLVLSLPVSSFSVMLARVLALYLESLLIIEMLLLPAGFAYLVNGGPGGIGFILLLLFVGLFIALLPTFLAVIFAFLVTLFASRFRFKSLMTMLFSLLLIGGIFAFSFTLSSFSNLSSTSNESINALREQLTQTLPIINWAVQGMLGNIPSLLLFSAVTLLPFLVVTWVFSLFFKRLLTNLSSHLLRNDYKLKQLSASGSYSALLNKELRKFFSSSALMLNAGIGIIMVILGSFVAVFFKSSIVASLDSIRGSVGGASLDAMLPILLLLGTCFMCSMTFVSCTSISLEGKTLWILKSSPISIWRIFAAKIVFNFLLGLVSNLFSVPLLSYVLGISPLKAVMIFINSLLFCALTSSLGLQINLLLPRMDAENDTIVVKQSASTLVTLVANLALVGLLIGFFSLFGSINFFAFSALLAALLLLLQGLVLLLLNTAGVKQFAAL